MTPPNLLIRTLAPSDDCLSFRSGNEMLDSWFRKYARGNQRLYGLTYVAVDGPSIVAYVTVSGSSVDRTTLTATSGPSRWPVLLLGRMAVAQVHQNQKIGGRLLLKHVFDLALRQHETVGCSAVVVDAKASALSFYEKHGFLRTLDPPSATHTRLYIPIGTIQAAANPSQHVTPS